MGTAQHARPYHRLKYTGMLMIDPDRSHSPPTLLERCLELSRKVGMLTQQALELSSWQGQQVGWRSGTYFNRVGAIAEQRDLTKKIPLTQE
jgi:hypothetical protein